MLKARKRFFLFVVVFRVLFVLFSKFCVVFLLLYEENQRRNKLIDLG
jgi:hypothetical protein